MPESQWVGTSLDVPVFVKLGVLKKVRFCNQDGYSPRRRQGWVEYGEGLEDSKSIFPLSPLKSLLWVVVVGGGRGEVLFFQAKAVKKNFPKFLPERNLGFLLMPIENCTIQPGALGDFV